MWHMQVLANMTFLLELDLSLNPLRIIPVQYPCWSYLEVCFFQRPQGVDCDRVANGLWYCNVGYLFRPAVEAHGRRVLASTVCIFVSLVS